MILSSSIVSSSSSLIEHRLNISTAPQYHLTLDTCTNGEIYNMVVRGGNEGGLDGFDIWGTNIWVHDVEVTNKDECVTVKVFPKEAQNVASAHNAQSPASYILVENVFCNWSGGCAIGSLGADTGISTNFPIFCDANRCQISNTWSTITSTLRTATKCS
jgi:hypothetical protein